jgi:hypothetical protein
MIGIVDLPSCAVGVDYRRRICGVCAMIPDHAALGDSKTKARLAELITTPLLFTWAEFGAFVEAETEKWARAARFSGAPGNPDRKISRSRSSSFPDRAWCPRRSRTATCERLCDLAGAIDE